MLKHSQRILFLNFVAIFALAWTPAHTFAKSQSDSLLSIATNASNPDSLRFLALYTFYEQNYFSKPDTSLKVMDYYLDLAKSKKQIEKEFTAYNSKGNIYNILGNSEDAILNFEKAIEIAKEKDNPIMMALAKSNIGISYSNSEQFLPAVRNYFEALEIYRLKKNKDGEARLLGNIAGIFFRLENYDLALEYYTEAIEVFNELGIKKHHVILCHLNIGLIHRELNNIPEAVIDFKKALNLAQQEKKLYHRIVANQELGGAYLKLNILDSANIHIDRALDLEKEFNQESDQFQLLLLKAEIAFEENPEIALKKAESLLPLIDDNKGLSSKSDFYELLYKCYKELGKDAESLEMHEKYILYSDSLESLEKDFTLVRETVKIEFENKLAQSELKSQEEESRLKKKQKSTILFILLGFAGLIGFILFMHKSKIKKNEAIKQALLDELESLKQVEPHTTIVGDLGTFQLNREIIESEIDRKLNDTDWNVLNILIDNPVIQNKEIAERAFRSVDGIGSSLRRMYDYFDIQETKYKKISLLMKAVKISNSR